MIPAILAIDLGSSTVKAAVVDHSGALRGTGAGTIELILGGDGAAEQSPDQLWAAVMGACRRAIGASSGLGPFAGRKFLDLVEANVPADLDIHIAWTTTGPTRPRRSATGSPNGALISHPPAPPGGRALVRAADQQTDQARRPSLHQGAERTILDYIDTTNQNPKPFKWTKSADDILAAIQRFCLRTIETAEQQAKIMRTSESGH